MSGHPLEGLLAERTLWLCAQPSVFSQEEALCTELQRLLAPSCARLQRVGHTLVCWGPRRGRPLIGLFGHLDTVPVHPGTRQEGRVGDRLYGLGASDMKAGLAVMWTLLEQLDLEALPVDLVMVFYDQEEGLYANNGLGPTLEQVPELSELDLAIALEPSDNVIQLGAVGTLLARVLFQGVAAHSARPWQGVNALHLAGSLLVDLHALAPVEVACGGYTFREVICATMGQGGRAVNVVPEHFELNLTYRFAPGKSLDQARRELLALVDGRAEVSFPDGRPSARVLTPENPHYQRMVRATGARQAPKQAWTDVARLDAVGIDALNFGPGRADQAHQKDEYVDLALLVEGYAMFERFLRAPLG